MRDPGQGALAFAGAFLAAAIIAAIIRSLT